MKENSLVARWNTILSSLLRLLLLFLILAVLTGLKVPFVPGAKAGFTALIVIGIAVSIAGNWRFAAGLKLTDPINIIGSVLGAAAVLLIVFTFKGISIPLIKGYQAAFTALAVLLCLKMALKILQNRQAKISNN